MSVRLWSLTMGVLMKLGKLQTSWLLCVEKYELCITRPIKVWGECTERDSHMFVEISHLFPG